MAARARFTMPRSKTTHTLSDPIFSEPSVEHGKVMPDPTYFVVKHPSDAPLYAELDRLHLIQARPFPRSRRAETKVYPLVEALGTLGPQKLRQIEQAGRIVFHSVGDTGATRSTTTQNLVTDALVADCQAAAPDVQPAFLFHLGDVVYSFAEAQYYYDQFYEPYRNYPGPVFAIPGNHDGMLPPEPAPGVTSLQTFLRNFCAADFSITPEAVSLHRTAMTQPGVYFALDAPFVRIIGLYSNALEDPGLISSENQRYPHVPDHQLGFLRAQLRRIKQEAYPGAVLLAVHHPPFSWSPPDAKSRVHGGSPLMLAEIDAICEAVGVYPHAFLSGHAHNYQRFTRRKPVGGRDCEVPFVVCGSGGHAVNALVPRGSPRPQLPAAADHLEPGLVVAGLDDQHFGFLRVTADARSLRISFCRADNADPQPAEVDVVNVDLASHTILAG